MNRNNKIFQIIFSILILGIAFLLLLCIGICSPKTVVRPAVVDAEGHPAPPPDMSATLPDFPELTVPTYIIPAPVTITGFADPEIVFRDEHIPPRAFLHEASIDSYAYDRAYIPSVSASNELSFKHTERHFISLDTMLGPLYYFDTSEYVDAIASAASYFPLPPPQSICPHDYFLFCSVKTPATPRPPDTYNEQLQSYIYYSRANESETDILQLSAVTGLFILNIIMICNLVYILKSPPDEKNP